MADKKKLTDPVSEQLDDAMMDEELDSLDPKHANQVASDKGLTLEEVGAIQARKTSAPHPFEGYRTGRKVQVGRERISSGELKGQYLMIPSTYLVLLKPSDEPVPDRSNEKLTLHTSKREGGGGDPKLSDGTRIITFGTYHTRTVTDRAGGQNYQVVFDREVNVGGSWLKCAIVPSHSQRAQVCFIFDMKRERVVPDPRYMLADTNQAVPLMRMFNALHWQRTKAERAANQFDATPETTVNDREAS